MIVTYVNEGFSTKKPSAPVGWIKAPVGRVNESGKIARLNLELAILDAVHECATVGVKWMCKMDAHASEEDSLGIFIKIIQ
jgi:hypothetical protein